MPAHFGEVIQIDLADQTSIDDCTNPCIAAFGVAGYPNQIFHKAEKTKFLIFFQVFLAAETPIHRDWALSPCRRRPGPENYIRLGLTRRAATTCRTARSGKQTPESRTARRRGTGPACFPSTTALAFACSFPAWPFPRHAPVPPFQRSTARVPALHNADIAWP